MARLTFAEIENTFSSMGYELVKLSSGYKVLPDNVKFKNLTVARDWLDEQIIIKKDEQDDFNENADVITDSNGFVQNEIYCSINDRYDYVNMSNDYSETCNPHCDLACELACTVEFPAPASVNGFVQNEIYCSINDRYDYVNMSNDYSETCNPHCDLACTVEFPTPAPASAKKIPLNSFESMYKAYAKPVKRTRAIGFGKCHLLAA